MNLVREPCMIIAFLSLLLFYLLVLHVLSCEINILLWRDRSLDIFGIDPNNFIHTHFNSVGPPGAHLDGPKPGKEEEISKLEFFNSVCRFRFLSKSYTDKLLIFSREHCQKREKRSFFRVSLTNLIIWSFFAFLTMFSWEY